MKTSLSHLPEKKQFEINHITEIIREVINPEMIILFGSYAKGKQVEHRYTASDGTLNEYISDYDFLVVTKKVTHETTDLEWTIEERSDIYDVPVNIEIHEAEFINEGLEKGQYFFTDIVKEGILLFDTGNVQFSEPKVLTNKEKKLIAQEYYETWFPKGSTFLKTANFNYSEGDFKLAAFLLHQTAESYYYTTLLVFTGYKPKTHNLKKLRNKSKHLSQELFLVFQPETSKKEKHLFEQLKKGYVDARYKRNYTVTKEEIEQLIDRLVKIKIIVEAICLNRIAEL